MTPSVDQKLHKFANLLPNWTLIPILTLLPNFGGFHRTLQRVRLANRGRLSLRTPGPVPFGRQFFPELVISTDLLSFEHPSVLLFCFYGNFAQLGKSQMVTRSRSVTVKNCVMSYQWRVSLYVVIIQHVV